MNKYSNGKPVIQQAVILTGDHPCMGCVFYIRGECLDTPEPCYDMENDTSFVWVYDEL